MTTAAPAQHDQNFVFLNKTWGPLTYITAHIEPHMQTAAGHQLLRQTGPPETHSMFKYRMGKKKNTEHFLNHTVFKTNQLAKAACAEIVLHVTYICDAVHIGWWNEWEAGKPELGGRWEKKKQEVNGMCQEGSQCCIRPAMSNITTLETLVVCFTADGLDGQNLIVSGSFQTCTSVSKVISMLQDFFFFP